MRQDAGGMLWGPGIPPEEGRYPGRAHTIRRENGLIVERDVVVPMRDGVELLADVFRPADQTDLPVVLTYSPYGKHGRKNFDMLEPVTGTEPILLDPGMKPGEVSSYTAWEGPDPVSFCAAGFAVINADMRGSWDCQGSLTFNSPQEAIDGYDLVEWAASQVWSNGRVGMAGVSYLAWSQWNVAAVRPPSLRAINPWEGFSEIYRDWRMQGGMRETEFSEWWIESTAYSRTRVEDVVAMAKAHPFFDDYWKDRAPALDHIEVPLYAVVDWGDHGIHTRGTIEGYKRASSSRKWLEVHGRLKWPYFYRPESVKRQIAFFSEFLKPGGAGSFTRPAVNIEVREAHFVGEVHDEQEWPIARTQYRELHLDARHGSLSAAPATQVSSVSYDAEHQGQEARFIHTFEEDTELTGNMALNAWITAPGADDADLFVAIDKLDLNGERVPFPFQSMFHNGPVSLGWLRATHRELDEELSTPAQPWHRHTRALPLPSGAPVLVNVEIWPSSTLFRAGESLVLRVSGQEFFTYPGAPVVITHGESCNRGRHVIHTGGPNNSYLLIPVVPRRGA